MKRVKTIVAGGYRYIESVFQFSGGVAAQPGFAIERALLPQPLPLDDGFAAIESHLTAVGRPTTALCACELRSPAPFTEAGFVEFNTAYVRTLERFGLYRDGANPVARTNVCPRTGKPDVPSIYAFCYTVPSETTQATFVVSGGAEAAEGAGDYVDSIVRLGDTSIDGLRDKVRYVRDEQALRLTALGMQWRDVVDTRLYTLHDVGPLLQAELLHQGVGLHGVRWYDASPPVQQCEFEMDARTVLRDIKLTEEK
ncbi:hypothetical protein [Mycobacterium sp. URHB0044]|uniref:2-amino-5-chloromuconate deaminase CnbZ n=1 Tax=Mycobacterium sp. URHB0044 TaxID=1380386 RepID=UPI000491AE74|nr:hypothetical protein [Mycobacterium sp. URHB0044]